MPYDEDDFTDWATTQPEWIALSKRFTQILKQQEWKESAALSELKEWLEKNKDVSYLGHGLSEYHERLVAAVKAAIEEKEE